MRTRIPKLFVQGFHLKNDSEDSKPRTYSSSTKEREWQTSPYPLFVLFSIVFVLGVLVVGYYQRSVVSLASGTFEMMLMEKLGGKMTLF